MLKTSSTWQNYWRVVEDVVETLVFASRWLLAPFYVGLSISIVVLLIKFMAELWHLVHDAFSMSEPEVIVGVLSLVDMALTGSLLIIVIFSGYENFVSRIDHEGHKDWPQWMGTIDFSALKLKLLSSIVAISAIQLLKQFMALNKISDRDLYFLVGIHFVFVLSSVLLALADRIAGHEGGHGGEPAHGSGHSGGHASESAAHKPSAKAHPVSPSPSRAADDVEADTGHDEAPVRTASSAPPAAAGRESAPGGGQASKPQAGKDPGKKGGSGHR